MARVRAIGITLLVALASATAAAIDCAAGCSSKLSPVTGSDGLVYANPCVAACQGVSVVSSSSSSNGDDDGAAGDGTRPVTAADLARYAAEGFRFLSFARVGGSFAPSSSSAVGAPDLAGLPTDRVVRYDAGSGAVYARAAPLTAADAALAAAVSYAAAAGSGPAQQQQQPQQPGQPLPPSTPPAPANGDDGVTLEPVVTVDVSAVSIGRKLLQQQQQQQQQQASSSSSSGDAIADLQTALPLAAVGQLLSHGEKWHCTAALVAERTVVTAAHCVFNRATGAFAKNLYFVPGRYRDAAGAVHAPYGAADVAEAFLLSRFVAGGAAADVVGADIAVVRLMPGTTFGSQAGHLGVSVPLPEAAASGAGSAAAATAAGLPADAARIKPTAAGAAAAPATTTRARKAVALTGGRRAMAPAAQQQQQQQQQQQPQQQRQPQWAAGALATAGYPEDRPEGTLVAVDACQATQPLASPGAPGAAILRLGCRTRAGQSGAPLVAPGALLRGVVSFEVAGAGGFSGGTAVTGLVWKALIEPHLA